MPDEQKRGPENIDWNLVQVALHKEENGEQLNGVEVVVLQKYREFLSKGGSPMQPEDAEAERKREEELKRFKKGAFEPDNKVPTRDASLQLHMPHRKEVLKRQFEELGLDASKITNENCPALANYFQGAAEAYLIDPRLKRRGLELILQEEKPSKVIFASPDSPKETKIDIVKQIFADVGVHPDTVNDMNYRYFFNFLSSLTQAPVKDKQFVGDCLRSIGVKLEEVLGKVPVLAPSGEDVEKFRNLLMIQYGISAEVVGRVNVDNYHFIVHEVKRDIAVDEVDKSKFTPEQLKTHRQSIIMEILTRYNPEEPFVGESILEAVSGEPDKQPQENKISTVSELSRMWDRVSGGSKEVKPDEEPHKFVTVESEELPRVVESMLLKGGLDTGAYKKLQKGLSEVGKKAAQAGEQAKDVSKTSSALQAVDLTDQNQFNQVIIDLHNDVSQKVQGLGEQVQEIGKQFTELSPMVEDVRRAKDLVNAFTERIGKRDKEVELIGAILCEIMESAGYNGKENPLKIVNEKPILQYIVKSLGITPDDLAKSKSFIDIIESRLNQKLGEYDAKLGQHSKTLEELASRKPSESVDLSNFVTQKELVDATTVKPGYVTPEHLEKRLSQLPKPEGYVTGDELEARLLKLNPAVKVSNKELKRLVGKQFTEASRAKVESYVNQRVEQALKNLPKQGISEQELPRLIQEGALSALTSPDARSKLELMIKQYVKPGITEDEKARIKDEVTKEVTDYLENDIILRGLISKGVSDEFKKLPRQTVSKEDLQAIVQRVKGELPDINEIKSSLTQIDEAYRKTVASHNEVLEATGRQNENYSRELTNALKKITEKADERRAGFEGKMREISGDLGNKTDRAIEEIDEKLAEAKKLQEEIEKSAKKAKDANISSKLGWKRAALIGAGLATAAALAGAHYSGRVNPKDAQVRYINDNDIPDVYYPGRGVLMDGTHLIPDSDYVRNLVKNPSTNYPPGCAPQVPERNPQSPQARRK